MNHLEQIYGVAQKESMVASTSCVRDSSFTLLHSSSTPSEHEVHHVYVALLLWALSSNAPPHNIYYRDVQCNPTIILKEKPYAAALLTPKRSSFCKFSIGQQSLHTAIL